MCLAVPGRVIEIDGDTATVDFRGNRAEVCTVLVPESRVDDWVLVHAGFAITRIEERAAKESWAYLDQSAGGDSVGSADDSESEKPA